MLPLPTAKKLIVLSACLAAAYTQFSTSPALIQYARSLGGMDWHIGILVALPVGMLFMQFVSAVVVTRLDHRKPLWFWATVIQRLVLVPAALGPLLFPDIESATWIMVLVAASAINQGIIHFANPLWLSWMGDYLPHQDLNRFWGLREVWGQWTAALALLAGALLFYESGLDIRQAFAILISMGAICGVCDAFLFIRIEEPPVHHLPTPNLKEVLWGPLRQRDFRSFIIFTCVFNLAAMTGAPFITVFLLEYVKMDMFHIMLIWTCSWVGGGIFAKRLGNLTERFGQRPVLILSVAFKSTNMLALLLIPPDPTVAFWVLVPIFMFDSILNSGYLIASNGFLIKNSPRANRAMFIAAGNAFAGIVGGLTSVAGGICLTLMSDWNFDWGGRAITNYHIMFAISLVLRLFTTWVARFIHEPTSSRTREVIFQIFSATRGGNVQVLLPEVQANHETTQPDNVPPSTVGQIPPQLIEDEPKC